MSDAVDLAGVENRVMAENRDLGRFARVAVFRLPFFPEDDGRAVFSFADVAADLLGLLVGQPERRIVAEGGKQEDVDAAVLFERR